MAQTPDGEGITAGNQPQELAVPSSNGTRTRFFGDGLDTGVKVQQDGRLDIKVRQHRRSIARLLKPFQRSCPEPPRSPSPIPSDRETDQTCGHKDKEPFPLFLNIVIHVVGSRGDVQPFLALGKALKEHGHRVRLATHKAFKSAVLNNGLEFFSIGGDPEEMMAFMVRNPGLMPDFQTIRSGDLQKHREYVKDMVCGCWRSCFEIGDGTADLDEEDYSKARPFVADIIIANPPSFAHVNCAEKLGIPLNMMFTMPWTATQAFPHPLANVKRFHARRTVANFVSYAIVEMIIWEGLGDIFNKFRKKELGLDPLDATRAPSLIHRLHIPFTYLWSPALLPKPEDWGERVDICGFSFLPSQTDYTPPPELDEFLKAGPPPVYIGFGSIVVDNPQKLAKSVLDAVRATGQRTVISKGWGLRHLEDESLSEKVLLIGNCPHDWLFQRVSCVVHHGGAGTTATSLALGRPTVVVSFFGDQAFWGSIVSRAGAGPKAIQYKELNAEKLAAGIRKALEESTLRRAGEIGEQMRSESGVENAVHSFHRHLNLEKLQCAFVPSKPAVWRLKHSDTVLSAVAAAVLIDTGRLKQHHLVLYRPVEYDTNRDPRGPVSGGAEVLVGAIARFITGVGVLPLEMLRVITTSRAMANSQQRKDESEQAPRQGVDTTTAARDQSDDGERPDDSENSDASDTEGQLQDLRLTTQQTRAARGGVGKISKPQMEDHNTGVAISRLAKRVLNGVILLPMDFTLSLSRGFHNAPKLYHDRMVKATRRVFGVRSGFKAAGEELVNGFYQGFTGLVAQPYHEFHRCQTSSSAPVRVLKGVGKGVGGVFLKPAAGLWGLAGYPLNGLHMNLRRSLAKSNAKYIADSRMAQGMLEMEELGADEKMMIIRRWRGSMGSRSY